LPRLAPITASALTAAQATMVILDLRPSMRFRAAHIPGSRWSIRPRLAADAAGLPRLPVVLVADDPAVAAMAAIDLEESGRRDLSVLEGGFEAWTRAGLPVEASPDTPADVDCIDYLFFVHDRHAGNRAAAQQYLDWETGLISQLDAQEKSVFRLGARH
jgi:rhodanese-related sulfurtransferase